MSRFEYPRLPLKEIIGVLVDTGIATVTEPDLTKPNSDFITDLFTRILIRINCLNEDHGLVEFADLEQLDNPDMHVDSVRMMNLFHKIKEVIAALDCPRQFNLKDLVKPEADRTQLFLSAILNFWVHRDYRMNILQPIMDEFEVLDAQGLELNQRISQLNDEISELNEAKEREMPFVQEIETKIKEMQQEIAALNNQQHSLKITIRKRREESTEMDQKISSAEFALVQTSQENGSLRSKIVQSPDKLQRTLEERKIAQVEAKNAERAAMQSFHEQTATDEVYTKARKKMTKHLTQMQTLQEQVNEAKKIEKDVKVLKTKNSDDTASDKSLEAKLYEKQGRVDQLEELQKQLEKEKELKCEEASKELNNVRAQVEYNRRGLEQRERNAEALVSEGAAINKNVIEVKDSATAKQQILLAKEDEITKEFFEYSKSMGQLLSRIEAGENE
nr:probable kinetochore protein NUF2 [Tanacetum cinerariifolium]